MSLLVIASASEPAEQANHSAMVALKTVLDWPHTISLPSSSLQSVTWHLQRFGNDPVS